MERYLVDLFTATAQEKSKVPGWLVRLYLSLFGVPLGKTIRIDMVRELLAGYEVKGKRILDVGCGAGDLSFMLAKQGAQVVGVELDAQKVESANKTARQWSLADLRFISADVTKLEEMGLGQFDMVFCLALLEHIQDDNSVLRQIHSLLRPGGLFIMEVPSARRKTIPAVEAEDGHARPGYLFEDVPTQLAQLDFRTLKRCTRDPLGLFYYWCLFSRIVPSSRGRGHLFAVLAPLFIPLIRLTSAAIKRPGTELGFLALKQE